MSAALSEVRTEAVPPDVFHLVFVWKRRDGIMRPLGAEGFVEPYEVGEAPANFHVRFRKGSEV